MSDQQNPDKLAQNLQNTSIGGQQQKQQGQQYAYNPNAASTFVPGQGYQAFQGYQGQPQGLQGQPQGQYGQYGAPQYGQQYGQQYGSGYNQYSDGYSQGYQAYNPQQPPQPQGMSLADFQKQQSAGGSTPAKPKRTLKLSGSSNIKLANAAKAPAKEDKKDEPAAETKAEKPKAQPKAETAKEAKPVAEKKEASKAPSAASSKSSTPAPAAAAPSVAATSTDALAQQQEEEVDEEVVRELFGGKDHLSIMFMGHVDAGKSTMGGNLLYLTDAVDKRTVEKYEREAKDAGRQGWYLSWIMDTNKEERNDGKTIEVGRAYFETAKRRYTILDAPGHKMYVSEMIGGASQADVGILVISARKGEYETGFEKGGQTREHAILAKNQGVNKLIVVVNKMDDPTVAWSEERYKDCTSRLSVFLKGIGYGKDDVSFMPVSGYTGAGLKNKVDPKDCPWYDGPSLLETLDSIPIANRKINGPFMLPISGKLRDMGTIVEGKIESGHIKRGGSLLLMPNKVKIEVSTIYNETEQECEQAFSGEQVRLKVKGVEEEDLAPGYVLTSVDRPVRTVTRFEAQIAIVELKSILSNGFSCVMHVHTAIEEVKFIELKHKLEKGTNRKSKKAPPFAKKGMRIIAVLETNEPFCAETFADYPQLGRFTLRDQGTTIAIGKITKLL